MISATLDTSVYIRALHFGGPATVIIGHARAGSIRIDISDAIVAETNRVLRDKFQWDGYSLQDAREKLRALGNHVSPTETLHVIKEDPRRRPHPRMRCDRQIGLHSQRRQGLASLGAIRQYANRIYQGVHQSGADAGEDGMTVCRRGLFAVSVPRR